MRRGEVLNSIKANVENDNMIKQLLKRPEGELSEKPVIHYHGFQYQAGSWDHSRRVMAKVEWHRGQLFSRERKHIATGFALLFHRRISWLI